VPLPGTLDGMETVVKQEMRPPRIVRISWGRMEVEGLGVGTDFKLYPGGVRAWDWAETGTRHSPGIQPADLEELVARGAATVVLSQGMNKQVHIRPDTCRYLDERSITVHVAETRQAAKIYNDLAEGAGCRALPLHLLTSAPLGEHADGRMCGRRFSLYCGDRTRCRMDDRRDQ
jgi:hypothetical protein